MRALIGNQVKTENADHVFPSREQAEAFYIALREREAARAQRARAERTSGGRMDAGGTPRQQ